MLSEKGKVEIIEKYISRESIPIMHQDEMSFYSLVKLGRISEIRAILDKKPFASNENKKLSDNPIQSIKYHLVVTAAMLARFCIEGGMDCNQAYELSDKYIRMADKASSNNEVIDINDKMCMEYVTQMNKIKKDSIYSKPIVKSIDYICSHLHCRITAKEISKAVLLNESYFSRLFKKEVGISVSRYILIRKIETAQNLLKHTNYSCSEISELLSFASQSHFIARFREECGITPLAYRNFNFNRMELG